VTSGGNNFNNFFYCKTFIMTGQPCGWGRGGQILYRGRQAPLASTGAGAGFPMSPR